MEFSHLKAEYITSIVDIHYSIIDIRFFRVSYLIYLAAFQVCGWAEPCLPCIA